MAAAAISRFVVLATQRIREQPEDSGELAALLYPAERVNDNETAGSMI